MKKILLSVLTILFAACMLFAGACSNDSSKNVKLVGFENQQISVAFGSVYLADAIAIDEDGNEYPTTIKVVDENGNEVEVFSSKFSVVSKKYTVTYTAKVGKKNFVKVDTITAIAGVEPAIAVDGTIKALLLGETYTLPTATAYDYFDGALNATAEVFKYGESEPVKCDLDDGGLTFTAEESGKYFVKFTVKNSADMQTVKTVDFFVRTLAEDGEWDTFDDEGAVYTTLVASSAVKKVGWVDTFNGRNGVLKVDIAKNNAYGSAFMAVPKTSFVNDYEDYDKLVISMFVDGEEGSLQNFRFCHPNIGNLPINPTYGGWETYVFDKTAVVNNWHNFARNNADKVDSKNHFTGTFLKDCTIYIDAIYFANVVDELEGSSIEENGIVTLDYSADNEQLGYTVLYDGKWVETVNNTFNAEYAGEYVIQPVVLNSKSKVYAGAPIIYNSVSANRLEVNEFDKTIALNASEYTLPQVKVVDANGAEVDGYDINVKTIFRSYANTIEERGFTTANKGWYEYIITASKEGEKTLYYNAHVKVGDYIDGEIFNVNDINAAQRVGAMFMGAKYSQADGEEIAEDYAGETFLKIATNLSDAYLTKTGYFNFNPSATVEDIDAFYDVIKVKFFVKGKVKAGATAENMTVTFFGQKADLKLNDWTEISVNVTAFASVYNKLCTPATWGDYAATFGNMNYSNFDEFAIYMSSIVAEKVATPEDVIIVDENNYSLYVNADVSMTYVSAVELASAGLSGDYSGNAVKWTHSHNNSGYKLTNVFSKRQLNELRNKYSLVEINFAVGSSGGRSEYVLLTTATSAGAPSLITVANGGSGLSISGANYNTWKKMYIPINDFVDFAYGKSSLPLFRTYCDAHFDRYYYFGDVKLLTPEEEPPISKDILKVTSKTSYIHNDYTENYLDAAGVNTLGFGGSYSGAAVSWTGVKNNTGSYRFEKPTYTQSQIANIRRNYKSVVLNVAMSASESATSGWYYWLCGGLLDLATADGTHNSYKVYKFTAANANTWRQFEIPVEDYLSFIANSGDYVDVCKYYYGEKYSAMTLYLGDIYFVPVDVA